MLAILALLSIKCFLCSANDKLSKLSTSNFNISKVPSTVVVLCNNNKYFCTGTIVDVSWVLTAAHCLYDLTGNLTEEDNSVLVVAGTNGLNYAKAEIKSGQAQIRISKKIVIHEDYNWNQNFVNDLALIKVSKAFVSSERVAVAVLNSTTVLVEEPIVVLDTPDHGEDKEMQCQSYGWSADDAGYIKLKELDVVISKHCHCLEWIRSFRSPVDILRQRNIFQCDIGSKKYEVGLCSGNNGGPVFCTGALRAVATTMFHYTKRDDCKLKDGHVQLECGGLESLNVFTDVCYFGKWLSSVVPTYPLLDEVCNVVSKL